MSCSAIVIYSGGVCVADITDMEVPEWSLDGGLFSDTPALPAPPRAHDTQVGHAHTICLYIM